MRFDVRNVISRGDAGELAPGNVEHGIPTIGVHAAAAIRSTETGTQGSLEALFEVDQRPRLDVAAGLVGG